MLKRWLSLLLIACGLGHPLSVAAANGRATTGNGTSPAAVQVIEYYNANLRHYFMTADPTEAALLDGGTVVRGWARTGWEFTAGAAAPLGSNMNPVCRFYGRPEAGLDSHFYSGSPAECQAVSVKFAASWALESTNVFQVQMPDAGSGTCPDDTVPVYRLFNNRADANHRYTTDAPTRAGMVASGYTAEGYGPTGVAFCASAAAAAPKASIAIADTATSPDTYSFSALTDVAFAGYSWNFGDGNTAAGFTVSHRFTAAGTYQVALTVQDAKGGSFVATKAITIATNNDVPTANMLVTMIAPDNFDFSSSATASSGATLVAYAWQFGDGGTATGATTSHLYTVSGTYPVVLTVADSKGKTATTTRQVTAKVGAPPLPPTQGPAGAWTRYGSSYQAGTEAEYQSWYNLAWDTKRNVAYGMNWDGVLAAFDPAVGTWTKLTAKLGGGIHNRTFAYDPINDQLWIGTGTGSQLLGVNRYDPKTRQFFNHPLTGALPGSEATMIYDSIGQRFIVFGGWGLLKVHTLALNPPATSMVDAHVAGGPAYGTDAQKMTGWRSALDTKRNRILYVDTDGSLWALPLSLSAWQQIATTGAPPPVMTQFVYDVANDALVGWSSSPKVAAGDTVPGTTRETWLLPLSSLGWVKAASAAAGNVVPGETPYVGYSLVYDPVREQTLLHTLIGNSNFAPETWAYRYPNGQNPTPPGPGPATPPPTPPAPPGTPTPTAFGVITSFPLPAIVGAPYSTLTKSKHTNMAYSPVTNRLYVEGGDWVTSATDGTWSMSMADGSWRQDVGKPVYPTLPAPHAAQDQMGFTWDPNRQKFILWPGSYYAYEAAGTPILEYAKGIWFFDVSTNAWKQELGLFGTKGTTTGSVFGGVYDEVNDHIVFLGDDASGFAARRWSVRDLVRLPDLPIKATRPKGFGTYYSRTMHAKIGRYAYVLGYSTDGTALKVPRFWRWHLDNHTFDELAAPPVNGSLMVDIETRLGASHGKVVWPFMNGPDGELRGIYVYDPATNVWSVDKQVPAYGNFIANAVASLPDGRVALSGGVFGRQQTHIWFYEAK